MSNAEKRVCYLIRELDKSEYLYSLFKKQPGQDGKVDSLILSSCHPSRWSLQVKYYLGSQEDKNRFQFFRSVPFKTAIVREYVSKDFSTVSVAIFEKKTQIIGMTILQ